MLCSALFLLGGGDSVMESLGRILASSIVAVATIGSRSSGAALAQDESTTVADAAATSASREFAEAITDPELNAWFTAQGNEIW